MKIGQVLGSLAAVTSIIVGGIAIYQFVMQSGDPTIGANSTGNHQPPPGGYVDAFTGLWLNENPATSGITRLQIDRRLNNITVHAWGQCTPQDCDWGTTTTDVSDGDDGELHLTWRQSFKVETQKLRVLQDGRLQVIRHSYFTDNSGRPDYNATHYFVKQ